MNVVASKKAHSVKLAMPGMPSRRNCFMARTSVMRWRLRTHVRGSCGRLRRIQAMTKSTMDQLVTTCASGAPMKPKAGRKPLRPA